MVSGSYGLAVSGHATGAGVPDLAVLVLTENKPDPNLFFKMIPEKDIDGNLELL
jgi:hypothetical protein